MTSELPGDLPNRDVVLAKTADHLGMIADANRQFNLTRIVSEEEALIKHVLDSVLPWRLFESATSVLDAGTGAGFPGIPLALVLPGVKFTLAESTGKKARFVEAAIGALGIPNAVVAARRAEDLIRESRFDIVTARAVAPVSRALEFFAPALKTGTILLLYKGPDAEQELADASGQLQKYRAKAEIAMRYELPRDMGRRTIVRIAAR